MRVRRPEPGPGYRGEVVNSKLYFPCHPRPTTPIPKNVVARQHEITADFQRPVAAHVADVAAGTALGRVSLPDDVGPVVAFRYSDAARWANARRPEASGGYALWPAGRANQAKTPSRCAAGRRFWLHSGKMLAGGSAQAIGVDLLAQHGQQAAVALPGLLSAFQLLLAGVYQVGEVLD